jgi:hypothetical protein
MIMQALKEVGPLADPRRGLSVEGRPWPGNDLL